MENNDLLEMVRSKAQGWLTKSYDAETRAQVQALLDNEDPTELIECFYKDLEFGTGGLRGIMGVGSNRSHSRTRARQESFPSRTALGAPPCPS